MSIVGTASNSNRNRNLRTARQRSEPIVRIELTGAAIQKILDFISPSTSIAEPTAKTEVHRLRPTLRPWIGIIDQILMKDSHIPKPHRTTAMRILKTLREEHHFTEATRSFRNMYSGRGPQLANPRVAGQRILAGKCLRRRSTFKNT
jgi:hypothetical protein